MNGFARKKWASFQEAAAMRTIDNCIAPCMEEKNFNLCIVAGVRLLRK